MKKMVLLIPFVFSMFFTLNLGASNGFIATSTYIYDFEDFLGLDGENYLCFANYTENQSDFYPLLLKLNSGGEVIDAKLVKEGSIWAKGIINLSDGNLLLIGSTSDEMLALAKIDRSNNIIWKKGYIQDSTDDMLWDIIETSDKGFLLSFLRIETSPSVVLLKISSDGDIVWQKHYEDIYEAVIAEIPGEGYYFATRKDDYTTLLYKLGPNGEVFWIKTLKSGKQLWIDGMTHLDNNLIVSCRIQDTNLDHALGILKFDPEGNLVSKRGYTNDFVYSGLPQIKRTFNDNFLILNTLKKSDTDWDIWLLKVDRDFNLLWENRFGFDLWDRVRDVVENSNGELFGIGYYDHEYPSPIYKSLALKLNSEGSLGFDCSFEKGVNSLDCDFSLKITDENVTSITDSNYTICDIPLQFEDLTPFSFNFICSSCPTITISPSTLPSGKSGESYSVQLSAEGGSSPYKFSLFSGKLPDGLTLSENGAISGTPDEGGIFNFTVSAVDSLNCGGKVDYTLHIEIVPPTISQVSKLSDPFRLKIKGSNFHQDLKVYIGSDQSNWSNLKYKSSSEIVLKGGTSLKSRFPKGVPVEIKVVNGDGGVATFTFTR